MIVYQYFIYVEIIRRLTIKRYSLLGVVIVVILIAGLAAVVVSSNSDSDEKQDQQTITQPVVGVLINAPQFSVDFVAPYVIPPLAAEFADEGYVEGENIDFMLALPSDEDGLSLEDAARSLVDADVDVVLVFGKPQYEAVRAVSETMPVLLVIDEADMTPAVSEELAQPDTQLAAIVNGTAHEKRFDILMQIDPNIDTVLILYSEEAQTVIDPIERLAAAYEVTLILSPYNDTTDILDLLENMPDEVDAIFTDGSVISTYLSELSDTALRRGIPLSANAVTAYPGLLVGYGTEVSASSEIAARFARQLFEGTPFSDMPPEIIDPQLVIHVGTAEAIGLDIPATLLEQADLVVYDPVTIPETLAASDLEGFCNAVMDSPLGADDVCITQSCAALDDEGFVTYSNKVDAESCSTEAVLGACVSETRTTYFYSGQVALFERGCTDNGSEWLASVE